ncbi:MAG: BatA domain-containing protein [bacterium]
MTFLAPWAFAMAAFAAAGMVVLHLVARQRPAAYTLPTTRFIPDQRTLVSRAATRPRDLLLLLLRVLLLLSAGAAFARPVLAPSRGALARVILLDRSRAVASAPDVIARARTLVRDGIPSTIIAFDSAVSVIQATALDSLNGSSGSPTIGSISAALIAARRASVVLAERADSVELVLVSPLAASEIDAATPRLRAEWPGAIRVERVALRTESSSTWRLEQALSADDQLGPAVAGDRVDANAKITRLVRHEVTADDSAFARSGATVVRWDSTSTARAAAEGLALGDDVVVAALGRRVVSGTGRAIARWADGSVAASEVSLGSGCVRDVGVAIPAAGDIALHPPFQRIVRGLLAPCNRTVAERAADSASVALITGTTRNAARADVLRGRNDRPSPLSRWLLALAIAFALTEMLVRAKAAPEVA